MTLPPFNTIVWSRPERITVGGTLYPMQDGVYVERHRVEGRGWVEITIRNLPQAAWKPGLAVELDGNHYTTTGLNKNGVKALRQEMSTATTTLNAASRTVWTGDNLDIMRGLNSASIDLIYLDPPFNSRRDYAAPSGSNAEGAGFKDTWTACDLSTDWVELIVDKHPKVFAACEAAIITHGEGMRSYLVMMAVRLLEMRRLLKPTGSIYLHCDPTASHYLKVLMDTVFGAGNYRNEIVWKRIKGGKQFTNQYGRSYDTLLFYSVSSRFAFNPQYLPLEASTLKGYRHEDEIGCYILENVNSPTPKGYFYTLNMGEAIPQYGYRMPEATAREWLKDGTLVVRRGVAPKRKKYLSDSKGAALQNLWTDIPPASGSESTGYPTQKPLALLERIISVSSNPGDVVLDPFCGCATAPVASEKLGRQWLGIDISPKAIQLVKERLNGLYDKPLLPFTIEERTDIPRRTDTRETA